MSALSVIVVGLVTLLLLAPCSLAAQDRAGTQPQDEPPSTRLTLERALIERGGLLLRPGELDLEPSVEYTFFSTRRIAVSGFSILPTLIIGVLQTEEVERNLLDTALTARLGLFKDFQADVRVPYRIAWDRLTTADAERTESNDGIGDIEVGLSYQPLRERELLPDLILGVRGKFRTGEDTFDVDTDEPPLGTGFYSVTGLVTAVRSFDPAALFATVLYTHNFDRSVRLPGEAFETEIDPGGSFGYILGLALALTPELGMNFRWEHRYVQPTETSPRRPGVASSKVPGSSINYGIAYVGINWAPTTRFSIDLSVGVGVTEDSPDMALRFAVPVRFNLW
jgi:hypothetical protein